MRKLIFMAMLALLATSCQNKEQNDKAPITKPEITIEGGRLTPEALWAMGRINSVLPNEQTNQLAYTVSYYSVEDNGWKAEAGEFQALIGPSSADIRTTASFELK